MASSSWLRVCSLEKISQPPHCFLVRGPQGYLLASVCVCPHVGARSPPDETDGDRERGSLGAIGQPVPQNSPLVSEVVSKLGDAPSPAAIAGLQTGDRIVGIGAAATGAGGGAGTAAGAGASLVTAGAEVVDAAAVEAGAVSLAAGAESGFDAG